MLSLLKLHRTLCDHLNFNYWVSYTIFLLVSGASKLWFIYSSLVGFDEKRHQQVYGIVDDLRTYTTNKIVESVLKTMEDMGKKPTVISPDEYKTRFMTISLVFQEMWPTYEILENRRGV